MSDVNLLKKRLINYREIKQRWTGFAKANPDDYMEVVKLTSFLPEDAGPTQRIWHIMNDIYHAPKCEKKGCEEKVKWYQNLYRKYCSTECSCKSTSSIQKRNESLLKKYGVSSFGKIRDNKEISKRVDKTNLDKYGSTKYLETDDFKNKSTETVKKRYGVDHYSKTLEFKKKVEKTLEERYGVTHNMQIPKTFLKREKTWQENYGGNPLANEDIREKIRTTNLEKYGYEHPTKNPDVLEKIRQTARKHNRENPSQYILNDESYELLENADWLASKREEGLSFNTIAKMLGVDSTTVVARFKRFNLDYIPFNITISKGQQEVINFISENICSEIIVNDRELIKPQEIDILIPEKKIAIEYCGLYWHSEAFLDKDYHYDKMLRVQSKGYRLITIFEDEWINKPEIVKSMLNNITGNITKRIYARKTTSQRILDTTQVLEFLDTNHLQGSINFSKAYGLYVNNTLVSVMTFLNGDNCITLNRFCSKLNTLVVGGASKLFNAFIKDNENDDFDIVSFSDNRWSSGELYHVLEFSQAKKLKPDYYYIDNNKRYHKFLYRKNKMKRRLTEYDSTLTEHENALNNGILRIYDCGKIKFTKKAEKTSSFRERSCQ